MTQHEAPGGDNRVERKKEQTKQKIIATAMELFQKQGIEATTMEQIAREVDIAKGTLYNYFPVKEAIIDEFMRRSFSGRHADRVARLRELPDTRTRMVAILTELVEGVQRQKELFERYIVYRIQSMISFHQDEETKSGFHLLSTTVIELGQQSGEIRDDLPLEILRDLFDFAFIEVAKLLYAEPENFDAPETIGRCVDLFLNGVRRRVGQVSD